MKKRNILVLLLVLCVAIAALTACNNQKQGDDVQTPSVAVKLSAPVIRADGYVVSWTAVENAAEYEVFVDNVSVGKQKTLNYTLDKTDVGTYAITVKALAGSESFIDSDVSNSVSIVIEPGKLLSPVVNVSGTEISWGAVAHASGYEVFVNEVSAGVQTGLTFTLVPTEYITYSVYVKALSDNENYVNSDNSNVVTYVHEKPKVTTPILEVAGETVEWLTSPKAESYEVYVGDELKATVTEGTYTLTGDPGIYVVRVRAIAADKDNYRDSDFASANVEIEAVTDLSKDIYVYSRHLEERLGKYVLGIADESNYDMLQDGYKDTLDNCVDNYLCNMPASSLWNDSDYAKYAWRLEEVTYNTELPWVHTGNKVYRIRLTDGYYLTVAKNNLIGTGGDYICESEYVENDIWQYWQFIKIDGKKNDYYIYNVGHGYDWNRTNDYLVDTSRNDGGAELYPMDSSNENYFPYIVKNVEGAEFENVKHKDYSGSYVLHTKLNSNVYAPASDDVIKVTDHTAAASVDTDVWTFEKSSVKEDGTIAYKIKFSDGRYLRMKDYILAVGSASDAQEFYIFEVAGVKNCFKICGALDIDFCIYNDSNDGQNRRYCYADSEKAGTPSRWWNSIDHRNDLGNYWIFTAKTTA